MELRLIHFYPDLMGLYGSYANVSVLKRSLEGLGNTVIVETVLPGQEAALEGADFLYMGAGTERSQLAALADFTCYGSTVCALAGEGTAMLFAGTAMELLGKTITDASGKEHPGIALADFTAVQGTRRIVGDVYGKTDLYPQAVVGFINKCAVISGVKTPLLTSLGLGFGNEAALGGRGLPLEKRVCLGADRSHPGKESPDAGCGDRRHLPAPEHTAAPGAAHGFLGGIGLCHYGGAAAAALPGQSEIIRKAPL